jgi:hypothetical protein
MWYNRGMKNDFALYWDFEGEELRSHFKLREFESSSGLVVVDPGLIRSLEMVRRDLERFFQEAIQIVITSGTRTEADNERLAERLGWCEDGGLVARDSRHLPKYGGIAVDCYARYSDGGPWTIVPQTILESACRVHFAYVKADYRDGHVHADNRKE